MSTNDAARPLAPSAEQAAVPRRFALTSVPVWVYQLLLIAAFLVFWQLASGRLIKELWVSTPLNVADRLVQLFATGEVWADIQVTFLEFLFGYIIGGIPGIIFGILLGRSRFWSDLLQPIIMGINSVPKSALAPLFIVWFGIEANSKIAMASTFTFFLIFVGTYAGVRNIEERFVNLARLMGASRWLVIRSIMLPSAAPEMLLGLRTAVAYGMIGAVVGEFISASRGLGYYIYYRSQLFDPAGVFAGIIILVAIVLALTGALEWLERRIIRWRPIAETRVAA